MKTLKRVIPLVLCLLIAGLFGVFHEKTPAVLPDEKPIIPGGEEALITYLTEHVVYPAEAKEKGIVGKVHVFFTVGNDGKLKEMELAKGVEPSLDKEALRIIGTIPDWQSGKKKGVPMDVRYTIAVQFQLESKTRE